MTRRWGFPTSTLPASSRRRSCTRGDMAAEATRASHRLPISQLGKAILAKYNNRFDNRSLQLPCRDTMPASTLRAMVRINNWGGLDDGWV